MKNLTLSTTLMLLISAVLFAAAVSILPELPAEFSRNKSNTGKEKNLINGESLQMINKALSEESKTESFTYAGAFESPFRKRGALTQKTSQSRIVPIPDRPRLSIKGILTKENPLAILEDERGETYIRGIGDNALGQEICQIKEDKIVLRDRRGTYELAVEEK